MQLSKTAVVKSNQLFPGHGIYRLIILLFVLVVFSQSLSFSFLVYDDPLNITKNPAVVSPSFHQLILIWQGPQHHLYIPVAYTAWMGIGALSNVFQGTLNPWLFHLANILLHIANTLLVYVILVRLLDGFDKHIEKNKNKIAALLAALLFALHPVQVEPVCWATGLKDLLSAFFFLLATYSLLFTGFLDRQNNFFPASALYTTTGFYLLSLLAKPQAVIFPVFVYILARYVMARKTSPKFILFIIIWLVMGLVDVC